MTDHLTENEIAGLFFTGLSAPALIIGGLIAFTIGVYQGVTTGDWFLPTVVLGGGAFGAGCGLLGMLGFYYWHRDLVEYQRDRDKMSINVDD